MKNISWKLVIRIMVILIALMTAISALSVYIIGQYNIYKLDPVVCEFVIGDPHEFCETKGKDHLLENNYTYAFVDKKENLILIMSRDDIQDYKNASYDLQILQAVLGDSKDIGVEINYENDPLYYIEYAPNCGMEISDDFKTISQSKGDVTYIGPLLSACFKMQLLEGVPSEEISVEFIRYNQDGTVYKVMEFPRDFGKEI